MPPTFVEQILINSVKIQNFLCQWVNQVYVGINMMINMVGISGHCIVFCCFFFCQIFLSPWRPLHTGIDLQKDQSRLLYIHECIDSVKRYFFARIKERMEIIQKEDDGDGCRTLILRCELTGVWVNWSRVFFT